MTLELNDLLTLIFERASAVRTLWSSYVVVASAVIGVHVSPTTKASASSTGQASGQLLVVAHWGPFILTAGQIILTVMFVAFAYFHFRHIQNVEKERCLLLSLFPKDAPGRSEWIGALKPLENRCLRVFHLVLDAAVILIVLLYPSGGGQ
jgi:hypothetical protein